MSDDLFNDDVVGEDEAEGFEPDPSTIAFLDQEAAAFAEIKAQFAEEFGFEHDCHCDTDYSSGKVVEVTECFAGMVVDALETCRRLTAENKALREMLTVMFKMTEELAVAEVEGAEAPGLASDGTPL